MGSICMKLTFPTGKEDGLARAMPKQRTGTGNVILWSILAEILHGIDDLGAVLHLVKNDERLFGQNLLSRWPASDSAESDPHPW